LGAFYLPVIYQSYRSPLTPLKKGGQEGFKSPKKGEECFKSHQKWGKSVWGDALTGDSDTEGRKLLYP